MNTDKDIVIESDATKGGDSEPVVKRAGGDPMKGVKLTTIARMAHEVNRIYCHAIGDKSQLPWEEAPEWQRHSCIQGVMFQIQNLDATPEDSHKGWLAHKLCTGWKYGPTKDETAKTHPCMVPYDQLPTEQKLKDHLFRGVVRVMLGLPLDMGKPRVWFGVDRLPARDRYGFTSHPDMALFDMLPEYQPIKPVLKEFGFETAYIDFGADASEELTDLYQEGDVELSVPKWTPSVPQGDGWLLAAIYDTEDGPYAMYVQPV